MVINGDMYSNINMYASNIGMLAIYGAFDDDGTAALGGVPIGGLYYSVYDGLLRIRQA